MLENVQNVKILYIKHLSRKSSGPFTSINV